MLKYPDQLFENPNVQLTVAQNRETRRILQSSRLNTESILAFLSEKQLIIRSARRVSLQTCDHVSQFVRRRVSFLALVPHRDAPHFDRLQFTYQSRSLSEQHGNKNDVFKGNSQTFDLFLFIFASLIIIIIEIFTIKKTDELTGNT